MAKIGTLIIFLKNIVGIILFFFVILKPLFAQNAQDSIPKRELIIDLEIRPRAEVRENYRLASTDISESEFYISQRNRLGINYKSKFFNVVGSFQEIHLWNKNNKISTIGSINAYELYLEPIFSKYFSVRVGRQAITLDNGRIFSSAPWAQQGRTHEGIRFVVTKNNLNTDLLLATTRNFSTPYDPAYSPMNGINYKYLFVHFLKYKFANGFAISTINACDVFEQTNNTNVLISRQTNGGRLDFVNTRWLFTLSGYYQSGQISSGQKVKSFYFQPEITHNLNSTNIRLGTEFLSGQSANYTGDVTHAFVPLYGVVWRFNGNMNLFTKFPNDVNGRGLINPYLLVLQKISKKISLRLDAHLFYSQHQLNGFANSLSNNYLGLETDFTINYKPNNRFHINLSYDFYFADKSMEQLRKVSNANKIPMWGYLMISYKPKEWRWRSF